VALALLAVLSVGLAMKAGNFLIVDAPRSSDVILVLAGETDRRPQRALQLLAQGYGRRVVLDVPANAKLYEFTQVDLARKYIEDLPQAAPLSICPIEGLSTKEESKDAEKCLRREGAKSVLIVTSDFHTRRALEIFRREIPGHEYSVAASRNDAGIRRPMVDPSAMGEDICGRMAAADLVESNRSVALNNQWSVISGGSGPRNFSDH
jgi:hypothetical protein